MANGHGGKRQGAGKPKGSQSRRSEAAMLLAEEKGVDPVEMLLDLTKWAYEQFQESKTKDNADMVKDYAKECAPYVRPKLSSIEAAGPDGGPFILQIMKQGKGA